MWSIFRRKTLWLTAANLLAAPFYGYVLIELILFLCLRFSAFQSYQALQRIIPKGAIGMLIFGLIPAMICIFLWIRESPKALGMQAIVIFLTMGLSVASFIRANSYREIMPMPNNWLEVLPGLLTLVGASMLIGLTVVFIIRKVKRVD